MSETVTTPVEGVASEPVAASEAEQQQEAPKAEPKPEPRKFKLKVNGKEEEADEDEVVKWAQLGRSSTSKFQEAAQLRKEAEDIVSRFRKDPKQALKDLGPEARKAAEEFLWEQIQEEQLSPEQKQQRETERKLKAYEEKEKAHEEEKKQAETEKLHQQYIQEYDQKIVKSLDVSGLPKTSGTVKKMANYMMQALNAGVDLDPSEAVEMVRQDYLADIKELLGNIDENRLLSILGDDVATKLRKADLARVKGSKPQSSPAQPQQASAPKSEEPRRHLSLEDFQADMEKKLAAFRK
jgi:hypothetical protein